MEGVLVPTSKPRRTRPAGTRERRPARPVPPPALHLELAGAIDGLPRDLGAILIGLGAVGITIPGPIPPGTVFVVAGVLVLRPELIARFGGPLARRFPRLFRFAIGYFQDLRSGLMRRYPASVAV